MSDPINAGQRADFLLNSDEWKDAWTAYRTRIMEEIEAAPSDATDRVMHLKRLLSAAVAAKAHLERIAAEGKVALAQLKLDEGKKARKFLPF